MPPCPVYRCPCDELPPPRTTRRPRSPEGSPTDSRPHLPRTLQTSSGHRSLLAQNGRQSLGILSLRVWRTTQWQPPGPPYGAQSEMPPTDKSWTCSFRCPRSPPSRAAVGIYDPHSSGRRRHPARLRKDLKGHALVVHFEEYAGYEC